MKQARPPMLYFLFILAARGSDIPMFATMTPRLLERKNAEGKKYLNVITVNWSEGVHKISSMPDLATNFGNSRLVSAQISYLLKKLKSLGKLSCDDVHIIGSSLGASIAGAVGKAGKKSPECIIGRITGERFSCMGSEALKEWRDRENSKTEEQELDCKSHFHTGSEPCM